jgi:hypothetical protein
VKASDHRDFCFGLSRLKLVCGEPRRITMKVDFGGHTFASTPELVNPENDSRLNSFLYGFLGVGRLALPSLNGDSLTPNDMQQGLLTPA